MIFITVVVASCFDMPSVVVVLVEVLSLPLLFFLFYFFCHLSIRVPTLARSQ